MYHNTTNESGSSLSRYKDLAQKQEAQVFEFFKIYGAMTASQVWKFFKVPPMVAPLTSIRRAITNLTYQGLLVKTDQKRPGLYTRSEYVYRIVEAQERPKPAMIRQQDSKQLALAL